MEKQKKSKKEKHLRWRKNSLDNDELKTKSITKKVEARICFGWYKTHEEDIE